MITSPDNAAKSAPTVRATTIAAARDSLWRRLAGRFWGYDFFISYRWASGGPYAVSLAERLRERGYDCFLDQSEFAAGDDWKLEAQKALRNSRRLVVIATRGAILESEAVRHEVDMFTRHSERVIPVVFGERFTADEQRRLPTLQKIPDTTIYIVEEIHRLERGPSDHVLDQLIQTHRLVRRRALRTMVVAAALAILTLTSIATTTFWWLAERARAEETRQKQLASAAKLVNRADLVRETHGPRLSDSLDDAVEAYRLSLLAGEPSEGARRAVAQALALMPDALTEPWFPFGDPAPATLHSLGDRMLVLRSEQEVGRDPYAVVAALEPDTGQWRVLHAFSVADNGPPLTDAYGERIAAPGNPRWLLTQQSQGVVVWDTRDASHVAALPFVQAPREDAGSELLALGIDARHALVRHGRDLAVWRVAGPPQRLTTLPDAWRPARYAIAPSGKQLARAAQNELAVIATKNGRTVLRYPITTGGGHPLALHFVAGPRHQPDLALYALWSENQVQARAPRARRDAPSHQAGIWYLGRDAVSPGFVSPAVGSPLANAPDVDGPVSNNPGADGARFARPDLVQVRANHFKIVFSGDTREPSVVILDKQDSVQWLDLESQLSFSLGAAAGPGTDVHFAGRTVLIVHTDGTARLWDLDEREELLRFAAGERAVVNADFLTSGDGDRRRASAIVTVDEGGSIRAWTAKPTAVSVETFLDVR